MNLMTLAIEMASMKLTVLMKLAAQTHLMMLTKSMNLKALHRE